MHAKIFVIAVIGLGLAAGTHIHEKIDHIVGTKAAILHKVYDVKAKKIELAKAVSQKAIDTVVAVKDKKVDLVKKLLHKKVVVHQPEVNVAYKVHKYHGVKVTPVIHTVEHSHIHVSAPASHGSYHSEVPQSYATAQSHSSFHSETPQYAVSSAVPISAPYPTYTQAHEPIHVSHVEPPTYTEWQKPEWVPTHVPDHQIVIQKKGLLSKLQDLHAVKQSWKPKVQVIKSQEVQPVIQESWSGASYPSHESSGSYWQEESPAPSAQWSTSSAQHIPSQELSYTVQYSVNHPGHSVSHQAIEQDYTHSPVHYSLNHPVQSTSREVQEYPHLTYSETDGHYQSPYHGQPLRNSYGEIVQGDVGYSASEKDEVSVVAPKSNDKDIEIEAPVEQEMLVEESHDHEAHKVEVNSSSSNTTTTV